MPGVALLTALIAFADTKLEQWEAPKQLGVQFTVNLKQILNCKIPCAATWNACVSELGVNKIVKDRTEKLDEYTSFGGDLGGQPLCNTNVRVTPRHAIMYTVLSALTKSGGQLGDETPPAVQQASQATYLIAAKSLSAAH